VRFLLVKCVQLLRDLLGSLGFEVARAVSSAQINSFLNMLRPVQTEFPLVRIGGGR
jgi:hypothetical protein